MMTSNWEDNNKFKERLTRINKQSTIEKSGIPMMFDEENLYVNTSEAHTIVIGATGSGKTQATLLPQARLAIMAGESLVVNDVKGEILDSLRNDLNKNNYNVITVDLENPKNGNKYNPLAMPYILYKNGEKDKAMTLIDSTAKYLFISETKDNRDPFWENTAINFFTGITLYLFEEGKENVTISDIYNFAVNIDKDIISKIDKSSAIYVNLSGTLLAPVETRNSIISVFMQKLKPFVARENLSKMMSETDFDIFNISNSKTALFIISGTSSYSTRIIPMMINQLYYSVYYFGNKEKFTNILLDEFDNILPISDIVNILNYSRGIRVRFTIYIKSLFDIKNRYGDVAAEMIMISVGNIIYLLANDFETLEQISNMCGKVKGVNGYEQLITVEELRLLNFFEAIILIPRMRPIRTKLIADYQIKW